MGCCAGRPRLGHPHTRRGRPGRLRPTRVGDVRAGEAPTGQRGARCAGRRRPGDRRERVLPAPQPAGRGVVAGACRGRPACCTITTCHGNGRTSPTIPHRRTTRAGRTSRSTTSVAWSWRRGASPRRPIYNTFDPVPPLGSREATRDALGVGGTTRLLLQPTRALARKNVGGAIALAEAVGGTFWLLGPAEDGYGPELERLVARARCPVLLGRPMRAARWRRLRRL